MKRTNKILNYIVTFTLCLLTSLENVVIAEDPIIVKIDKNLAEEGVYVPSKEVVAGRSIYPKKEWKDKIEGWVEVFYSVDKNGNIFDFGVHDSTQIKAFEKAALQAIKASKFEPARLNGQTVAEMFRRRMYTFNIDDKAKHNSSFESYLRNSYEFLRNGELDTAKEYADRLNKKRKTYMEDSAYWLFLFDLEKKYASSDRVVEVLNRAKFFNGMYFDLDDSTYDYVLRNLYIAYMESSQFSNAIKIAKQLQSRDKESSKNAGIISHFESVKNSIDTAPLIARNTHIPDSGNNFRIHTLHRNIFEVTSHKGQLEGLALSCDKKIFQYFDDISNKIFSVPSAWDMECEIYIKGQHGVQFEIREYSSL